MKYLLGLLAVLYALSPYDLFPDMVIGWGWIDDLIVLILAWYFLWSRKSRYHYKDNAGSGRRSSSLGRNGASHDEGAGKEGAGANRKTTSKDPYTVLGVSPSSSGEEIRAAYRRLANRYHPDKVNHLGDEFKDLAEKRFKEIKRAYEELAPK